MAEGLSHRLNEYLKTGQTTEEVNYTASADKNQDGGFRKSSNWEGQRSQNHERRSSLTSFADLYERAVRNVLSIRPLFDSPMDIFAQRPNDASNQQLPVPQQQQQHHPASKNIRPEKGLQPGYNSLEKENPDRRSSIKREDPWPVKSEYLPSRNEQSTSRFFAHALSEQMRQNRPQNYASPPIPPPRPYFNSEQNSISGQNISGRMMEQSGSFNADNSTYYNRVPDGYRRYWPQNQHYRHKPGMLDGLRHTPHHRLESQSHQTQTSYPKTETRDDNSTLDNDKTETQEITGENSVKNGEKDNRNSDDIISFKNLTPAEIEKYKDRARENARLKYRPYSLRSKKNGLRKKFGRLRKKNYKNKRQSVVRSSWQPKSTQEVFLFGLGLMRKSSEPKAHQDDSEVKKESQ